MKALAGNVKKLFFKLQSNYNSVRSNSCVLMKLTHKRGIPNLSSPKKRGAVRRIPGGLTLQMANSSDK